MSYLLTEIALEMLGYKFYNIYGMQEEINNFQKHSNNERSVECNANEGNLAELLGISTDGERNRKVNYNKEILDDFTMPEALKKLMDTEYKKVRQEVLHNKSNSKDNQNGQDTHNFIDAEHEKLRLEHQVLRNFRKVVEQNLLQINPTSFEKYCQTFKPARKQVKRLDTNKKSI